MKKVWIILFFGCTATQVQQRTAPAPLAKVYTPAEATKLIDSLLALVVYMNPTEWQKNKNGTFSPSTKQRIDTIMTKNELVIMLAPKDTTNPHGGNDTLIHAPN